MSSTARTNMPLADEMPLHGHDSKSDSETDVDMAGKEEEVCNPALASAVQKSLAALAEVQQLLELQQKEMKVLRARLSHKQEIFDNSMDTCDRMTRMDSSRLRYDCAGLHEKATRTLFQLDTIESHGDASVRKTRKGLSLLLNALADEAEQLASEASDHLAALESLPAAEDDTSSPSSASQTDDADSDVGDDDEEREEEEEEEEGKENEDVMVFDPLPEHELGCEESSREEQDDDHDEGLVVESDLQQEERDTDDDADNVEEEDEEEDDDDEEEGSSNEEQDEDEQTYEDDQDQEEQNDDEPSATEPSADDARASSGRSRGRRPYPHRDQVTVNAIPTTSGWVSQLTLPHHAHLDSIKFEAVGLTKNSSGLRVTISHPFRSQSALIRFPHAADLDRARASVRGRTLTVMATPRRQRHEDFPFVQHVPHPFGFEPQYNGPQYQRTHPWMHGRRSPMMSSYTRSPFDAFFA